jgi:hypothetical protein
MYAADAKQVSVADIDGAVNRRDRDNMFVRKGAFHMPGLRLGDMDTAGRMAYLVEKGDATMEEWNTFTDRMRNENRLSDPDAAIRTPVAPAAKYVSVADAPKAEEAKTKVPKGMSVDDAKAYLEDMGLEFLVPGGMDTIARMQQGKRLARRI